jgi:hypothetical protein
MAPVLKTGDPQGSVGSNPTLSVAENPVQHWVSSRQHLIGPPEQAQRALRIAASADHTRNPNRQRKPS